MNKILRTTLSIIFHFSRMCGRVFVLAPLCLTHSVLFVCWSCMVYVSLQIVWLASCKIQWVKTERERLRANNNTIIKKIFEKKKYNRSSCVGILPAIYWFGGCWHRSVETSTPLQKCRMNRCCRMAIAFSFSFYFSTFSTVMLGIVRLCMEIKCVCPFPVPGDSF